ncbi:DoxX family protein [Flavitalea flava]
MKKQKAIYWTTTGIVCAVMVYSAINFNLKVPLGPAMYKTEGPFVHLKLPDYMRIELTTAKVLGIFALLIPAIPAKIKGFAYAGFAIVLISASFAHFSVGDGFFFIIDPLIFLGFLTVSYVYYNRLVGKDNSSPTEITPSPRNKRF